MSAISAIDIALWDIKGKALGVPVYELLGGKTREKVRVYASVMHLTEDKQELAKQYQQLQEMGFTAAKIFCNGPRRTARGNSSPAALSGRWRKSAWPARRSALILTSCWKCTAV